MILKAPQICTTLPQWLRTSMERLSIGQGGAHPDFGSRPARASNDGCMVESIADDKAALADEQGNDG